MPNGPPCYLKRFVARLAKEQIHTFESNFQISTNLLDFGVAFRSVISFFCLDRTYCDVWPLAIYVGKTAESLGEFN